MPRTILDTKRLSPEEARRRIVRSAASREGYNSGRQIAGALGVTDSYMSDRLTGHTPWTLYDLRQMWKRLRLSDAELLAFVKGEMP